MKVLLTSVPAGSGHVKAAQALQAAYVREAPLVHVRHLDVTSVMPSAFHRLYVRGYDLTVQRAPALWGAMYDFFDRHKPEGRLVPLVYAAQRQFASRFHDYLNVFRPDLILTTHFLTPQLLEAGRRPLPCPVETVITDYQAHQFWISKVVSRYYVAHDSLAEELVRRGVPEHRITVSGIPVHPKFEAAVQPSDIFSRLKLNPLQPVVLVLGGGIGLNSVEDSVRRLIKAEGPFQVVSVAGRNEALQRRVAVLAPSTSKRIISLGYVDNMHELLRISNVVITKPGGMTVSECLLQRKLMILVSPIPGQEAHNANFLVARNAALRAESLFNLPDLVTAILESASLRRRLRAGLEKCAQPSPAFSIVRSTLSRQALAA